MFLSDWDSKQYFEEALVFLKEHQWLYNYPNTHILVEKVFDKFPKEWQVPLGNLTIAELNALPFGYTGETWPESLKKLISQIQNLKAQILHYKEINIPELSTNVRLSPKKRHEIVRLAAVVHDICQNENISVIVDIGAGLGYLSQLLFEKYNYKVLAIEGDEKNFSLAEANQKKYHPQSTGSVKYIKHFITDKSVPSFKSLLKDFGNPNKICITGLHACADLSIDILNIFFYLSEAVALVVMPCCYHRLATDQESFKNFPASGILKSVFETLNGSTFLKTPFLRLACQQSGNLWKNMSEEDHSKHSMGCMFRAIVEEVAVVENLQVRRLKRKTGKVKHSHTIEDHISNLKHTHQLLSRSGVAPEIDDMSFTAKIREKWGAEKGNCLLVEVLTAFQTSLQSICENIVLLDRVELLTQKGLRADVYRVADDRISPRCYALVAVKQ